jgi:hypothetical protein
VVHDDLDRLAHERPFGHVACDREHAAATPELLFRAQQLLAIARQEYDTCPFLSQLPRQQQSEPARPARNDDNTTCICKTFAHHWL